MIHNRKILKCEMVGLVFGRLTVVKRSYDKPYIAWECVCLCGNTIVVEGKRLRRGGTKSCGCLRKEMITESNTKHGYTKGGVIPSEYMAWMAMKRRCYDKSHPSYEDYGGRGILVCDRWLNSFENFIKDMGPKPGPEYSLDRWPNNETGNYEPGNCRWGTDQEQSNNRRSNHWIEYRGESKVLQEWADLFGVSQATLGQRLNRKSIEEVFEFSKNPENKGKYLR